MNTITLWLLVAISSGSRNSGDVDVVDRFNTVADCQHVERAIREIGQGDVTLRCIQAKVARP